MKSRPLCASAAFFVTFAALLSGCPDKKGEEAKVSLPPPDAVATAESPVSTPAIVQTPQIISTPTPTLAPTADASLAARVSGTVTSNTQGAASFKVGGHVYKTHVRVGESVRKGQVLAEIDATDFLLRERLANAGLQQAKVQFEQSQRDMAREEQLRKENATSQSSIERMSTAFAGAKVAFETAQINLETARKAVADTKLLATFNGIVTKKMKSEGEFVGAGAPVYEVADTSQLEISLKVPESLIRNIRVGRSLIVSSPSTDVQIPVKVVRIVPVISESSRTFEIICASTKPGIALYPGQYVEADLN